MKSLGIDIGSSSVKVSLLDIPTGECVASATNPAAEMPIEAPRNEPAPEKKHRPKFVDFFMRKNSDKK